MTHEEELRQRALEFALQTAALDPGGPVASNVIAIARMYYNFLKGLN